MKVLLLIGDEYSLKRSLVKALIQSGCEVSTFNWRKVYSSAVNKYYGQLFRLPYKFRRNFEITYQKKINAAIKSMTDSVNPDLVLVYNNEMLNIKTLRSIKAKSKIAFILGDSPYYSPTNTENLQLLCESDYIFAPDTFWIEQLKKLGIDNIEFLQTGSNEEDNYTRECSEEEKKRYGNDAVFIGLQYSGAWGYKRALFLNSFSDLDLRIYGSSAWGRWVDIFPSLKDKIVLHSGRLPFDTVNTIMNCGKIYPVDVNPGILNGIHIRVYECINSGILPIVEYTKDLDSVFKGTDLPIIKDYRESKEIGEYYISHEKERKELVDKLRVFVSNHYTPALAAKTMIDRIFK
jgi:hypothetical protein